MKYTRPLAISTRHYDGSLETEVCSMIIINEEGWAITAGHAFDAHLKFKNDTKKIEEIKEINAAHHSENGSPSSEIKIDKSLLTHHSFWFGMDGARFTEGYVNRQLDIAVGKLEPFDSSMITEYPVFADPDHMRIGTSICTAGYPFINIKPEFNEQMNAFRIPKIPSESLFYPINGIFTHVERKGKSIDGSYERNYIETSATAIKGLSGGPIFDKNSRIFGMQVWADNRPLGFHPTAEIDGQKYIENQFMNISIGLHASTIMDVLDSKGIKYRKEGDESGFRIIG